jgi:hypothetical protein
LLDLRWTGFLHNLVSVLLLLGVPLSVVGLVGLPMAWRGGGRGVGGGGRGVGGAPDFSPLRPLVVFSVITFAIASFVFPVSTTWGTFLHGAGAIHVLFLISALLVLDGVIAWVGARRGWTRPVAWLGPAFAIAGCLLFSGVLLADDGRASRATAEKYEALAAALVDPSFAAPLDAEPGPIITDFPIWLSEATRHHAIALPNEGPDSILDLASTFDPPARLLVVDAANAGVWPAVIFSGAPRSECFVPLDLPPVAGHPGALDDVLAFRIRC